MTDCVTDNDRLRVGARCNYLSWNAGELKKRKEVSVETVAESKIFAKSAWGVLIIILRCFSLLSVSVRQRFSRMKFIQDCVKLRF